jgi:hypothetical protein
MKMELKDLKEKYNMIRSRERDEIQNECGTYEYIIILSLL